jgi:hypothetical protein
MNETQYQMKLIEKIRELLPGCVILKNDPRYMQGVPDILILYNNTWAMLEVKRSLTAGLRPNQEYYVGLLNDMSFASFINPDNEERVLNDLQHSFRIIGASRIPQSK